MKNLTFILTSRLILLCSDLLLAANWRELSTKPVLIILGVWCTIVLMLRYHSHMVHLKYGKALSLTWVKNSHLKRLAFIVTIKFCPWGENCPIPGKIWVLELKNLFEKDWNLHKSYMYKKQNIQNFWKCPLHQYNNPNANVLYLITNVKIFIIKSLKF